MCFTRMLWMRSNSATCGRATMGQESESTPCLFSNRGAGTHLSGRLTFNNRVEERGSCQAAFSAFGCGIESLWRVELPIR